VKRLFVVCLLALAAFSTRTAALSAQGVSAASMSIQLNDATGAPVAGAQVTAVHGPSGTSYTGTTRSDGRVTLQGMRVGGPYKVSTIIIGYTPAVKNEIYLSLGVTADLALTANKAAVSLSELSVTTQATKDAVFSSERTGASSSVPKEVFGVLPTIARGLDNFTRLTPQASGTSFAGQDNRLNNITVDGTYFNNSFGLGSAPGARTNVASISLDAIEQVQVNVAPFDVRQGNFTGAGVNTVTRSGTNSFAGSLYYNGRNQDFNGTQAGALTCTSCSLPFSFHQLGASLGGPIIKNKLFFFGSYESDASAQPGTTFLANTGGQTVGGSTTRVLASDLDSLSAYMLKNFNYNTGPYQGYNFNVPSNRFLGKLDYNLNDKNKVSLRYNQLNSSSDQLESGSNSLGVLGNRNNNSNSMSFQNSNYKIKENNRSFAANLNSSFGGNKANELIIGYFKSDESRDSLSGTFPLIDIQNGGTTYTSLGFEPFTPGNQLRYHSTQVQDNFTIFGKNHDLNFGASVEKYHSDNVFFPGSQSVYVYNSLADFYADANGYLANPTRTTSPVTLRRFQVRYNNIPGSVEPLQQLQVLSTSAYAQDNWRLAKNLKINVGVRVDFHSFDSTALVNSAANGLSFRDNTGATVQYRTQQLPDATPLWSPRFGFNWQNDAKSTQIRGGTGVFSGSPPYVWISNQVGSNGILTGFTQVDNTTAYPFNPNANAYKPTTVTGAPASSYELDFTSKNFKFSQVWRTDLAIDQKLPLGLTGTAEYIYNKDVNGPAYYNANLVAPTGTAFGGVEAARLRYPTVNKINSNITAAYVIGNESIGYSWVGAGSLERAFGNGFYAKAGYAYGVSKNTFDPGSVAGGSWTSNATAGDPNNPGLGYSSNSPGKRLFVAISKRFEYFKFGATTVSLYYNAATFGNGSYTYSGDINNDGSATNDLIYIPKNTSEMNFKSLTQNGVTFSAADQTTAWEAVISQDKYLSAHRGEFAQRNAVFLPVVKRADFSVVQEVFGRVAHAKNQLQFRLDILNVGNLINKNWGIGQSFITGQPLVGQTTPDASGNLTYTLKTTGTGVNTKLITTLLQPNATQSDVYRLQLGGRYNFF
jgi:outer membrane receptor protein involved in Fe transport